MSGMNEQDIIVRLLSAAGGRKEVEQYLKHYSAVDSQKFAIIKVGGQIIDSSLDSLASSLTFLSRVGLHPIVIHGAGPQLDRAVEEAGIPAGKIDGLRVTTPEVLTIARQVFERTNLKLADALERMGTRARPVLGGVFACERLADARLGLVGEVRGVRLEAVEAAIRANLMPVIAPVGETADGQILNINADVAARELALAVKPHKVIYLTETGGLLDEQKNQISVINLREEYEDLMAQPWVHSGMRLKLREIKALLDNMPGHASVSIAHPDNLAKELFTHKGSGTLVRLGERVDCLKSFDQLDRERLAHLLETCFGRELTPGYFESKNPYRIYLAESYRATAIVTMERDIPYLDKFAVTTEAQGIGIGGSIWNRMKRENPRLFWRARVKNPINPWYFEQAEGSWKNREWVVFWYGVSSFQEVRNCIEHALSLPPTLRDHGEADG
ncbi:MAG: Acetylglutamate kinase [Myxococcota bacterium]|nr:Acetylglutamate kinase [Myxococcota bacterium]